MTTPLCASTPCTQVGSGSLVVIDFTASWCGPCRMAAPQFEAMARRYPDVVFAKVVEDNSKDIIASEGIQAFPTFRVYLNSQMLEEFRGANMGALEAAVQRHQASAGPVSFSGSGFSLGGGGPGPSSAEAAAEEARIARLRRLGIDPSAPAPTAAASKPAAVAPAAKAPASGAMASSPDPMDTASVGDDTGGEDSGRTAADLDKEDAEDEALLASMIKKVAAGSSSGEAGSGGEGTAEGGAMQMVEPPVDQALLQSLLEFEFPEIRAKKALLAVNNSSVDAAIQWITDHQEDADIDAPIALVPQLDMSALPGAGPPKKKITLEELKARIAARRAERNEMEKKEEVQREKLRRESGKSIIKTNEELQRLQRQREFAAMRKEKEAQKAERERLRMEIAKDKAERASRGGYLPGRLDADGYNPSGLQGAYGASVAGGEDTSEGGVGTGTTVEKVPRAVGSGKGEEAMAPGTTSMESVEKAIGLMKRQRIADGGGMALKTLIAYVKNIAGTPGEEKFRSINLENKAFKSRVAPVLGGSSLLKAIGFTKDDVEGRWFLAPEHVDVAFLGEVKGKLEAALIEYASEI